MNSLNNNYGNFQDFDVQLFRDSLSRPWGFRIQGGADFNFPLTVQRVFSGSPSEVKLLRGDIILALDGYDVGRLTHKQAQDVIRVAGASLMIRVRRLGSKPTNTVTSSTHIRRPHSTTPLQDSSLSTTNQSLKSTWQSPTSPQKSSSSIGNFGIQFEPSKTLSIHHRSVSSPSHQSSRLSSQSPYEEEDFGLKRVEDSLQKLTMNHLSNEEEEVDYSFTKKSVSERRKFFQNNDSRSQTDYRPRATSCTPSLRAISYNIQFSSPTSQMSTSYIEPTRNTCRTTASTMSSSYTEGTRNRLSQSPQKPVGGLNFGWSPSPEKIAAARLTPLLCSASQIQQSVTASRDSSRGNSPEYEPWRGTLGGRSSLMRSTSVSVLQESPTRSTIQRYESSTPGQDLSQEPSKSSWRVYQSPVSNWSPSSVTAKKFSTSATIHVGQATPKRRPIRTVRRFSTSSTPMDGTMSLDRRHHEPLHISIGSSCQADYQPAYPANVYQQVDRSWLKPSRQSQPLQRSASQKTSSRQSVKAEVGTYRPLQQSYSYNRSQSATDPDHMSSDF